MPTKQHTAAPWHIREIDPNTTGIFGRTISGEAVCKIPHPIGQDEAAANAELIKLAPLMFWALSLMIEARKESTEAFRLASYAPDVQAVLDAVEVLANNK